MVSDSNNYKKSEAILRKLEARYSLKAVAQSNHHAIERASYISIGLYNNITANKGSYTGIEQSSKVSQRAATKEELEMVIRTGKPSDKMLLQEKMKILLRQPFMTIPDLIKNGKKEGIYFLFNQASTGRITGITYFHADFKIKGQALGSRFKWSELFKIMSDEQIRDSQANDSTRVAYADNGPKQEDQQEGKEETILKLLYLMQQNSLNSVKFMNGIAEA